jgi:hypothetical protein
MVRLDMFALCSLHMVFTAYDTLGNWVTAQYMLHVLSLCTLQSAGYALFEHAC